MSDDDRDLSNRFARLRAEDRSRVPPFRVPVAGNASRSRWPIGIAVAAALALIALVLTQRDPGRLVPIDLSVAAWRSPTDFLLITPGGEMLRTVPAVGSPNDWIPIDLRTRLPMPESTRFQRPPS
jgi:hypothetical protein